MARTRTPEIGWPDERLVRACLDGDERAWKVLVDKYKNLIYSIPLRYGIPADDAADVFQTAWLDAYNDLPKLRETRAVKAWLVKLTSHKCYHWKKKHQKQARREVDDEDLHELEEDAALATEVLEGIERDQQVREAVFGLSERCREMIRLLFYTTPPIPYQEVAERLGLATGSIGFIRGRCLERLRRNLEKKGVR